MKVFALILVFASICLAAENDFPMYFPFKDNTPPKLTQISELIQTSDYPEPGPLFDDSQVIKVDVTTESEPKTDKEYVPGTVAITTMTNKLPASACEVRLTGDGSLSADIKNYYFKAPKDQPDLFFGWDRFSIKKSMLDNTLCREKMGSDIAVALGYYPRYVGYASVTVNGIYKGTYAVMQRMRKQWIQRTFGPSKESGQKRGSQYKGDNGNTGTVYTKTSRNANYDVSNIYPIEYTNPSQNLESDNVTVREGKDLIEFSKQIHTYGSKDTLDEVDKDTLRNLVDYRYFVRAHVLDFFSGDDDGYFIQQMSNHEWYHDIIDKKWKLLRWDLDDGFHWELYSVNRLYTLHRPTGKTVPVLKALLKDEQYVELYRKILFNTAKQIMPYWDGSGPKPTYFTRLETFFSIVASMDVYDRSQSDPDETGPTTPEELYTLNHGILKELNARSQQVIQQAEANNWDTGIMDLTTLKPPLPLPTSTVATISSTTVTLPSSSKVAITGTSLPVTTKSSTTSVNAVSSSTGISTETLNNVASEPGSGSTYSWSTTTTCIYISLLFGGLL